MFTFEEMRNFLTQELEKCTKTLLDEISNLRVEVQNLKESNIDIVRLLSDNLPEFQKSVAVPANIDQSSWHLEDTMSFLNSLSEYVTNSVSGLTSTFQIPSGASFMDRFNETIEL
ncbi:hypothetical protein JTB14_022051 [Gonioctena quinquepunctata]|nr:hypothetical protein JTB14_022051 [Gonioctena quinquepunctata]